MVYSAIFQRASPGAGNQAGLRDRNARVVLSLIRRHDALPSAEIARRTGLSAQTVSNIIRALENDGLLRRKSALKGKVGKPSVPMALNPRGVLSLGLNIGRRSAELVLVDFNGKPLDQRRTSFDYPDIDSVFHFLSTSIAEIFAANPGSERLVTGIGVGRPAKIWNWLEIVNAPEEAMRNWRDLNLQERVRQETGLDVIIENDATSACVAEHLVGRGNEFKNFAYIFVGAFVGGGLVLDGKVVTGPNGNAAAFGPLPVPDGKGGVTQLLNVASLHVLESALVEAGQDPSALRSEDKSWEDFEPWITKWLTATGTNLAIAAASVASVVEVEAVLIDGAMPPNVRDRLTAFTRDEVSVLDLTGITPPIIDSAAVGRTARSIGAALLPIHSRFFLT